MKLYYPIAGVWLALTTICACYQKDSTGVEQHAANEEVAAYTTEK